MIKMKTSHSDDAGIGFGDPSVPDSSAGVSSISIHSASALAL